MKEYFLIEHSGMVNENNIRDNIIVNVCKNLEDYNKVFLNLGSKISR